MPSTNPERQKNLNAAAAAAAKTLKENHQDEFNDLMKTEAANLGEEWAPRKTAEQKAEEELAALLEQFPALAEKIQGDVNPNYVTGPTTTGNA